MTTPYAGRHRGTQPCRNSMQGTAAFGRPNALLKQALRRPLLSTSAAMAVLAATAAGYATSQHQTSGAAYAVGAQALAHPVGSSASQVGDSAGFEAAKAAGNHQRTVVAAQAAAAEQAMRARLAAQREAADAARQAAAERAARAQERASILARAQADPRSVAKLMLADRGWSGQFSCLDSLWTKESHWNYQASNASSGAYGIPQALPGSKMGSVAPDWQTNPVTQITWGLNYIASVYGTPCAAWGHSQAMNWY